MGMYDEMCNAHMVYFVTSGHVLRSNICNSNSPSTQTWSLDSKVDT